MPMYNKNSQYDLLVSGEYIISVPIEMNNDAMDIIAVGDEV